MQLRKYPRIPQKVIHNFILYLNNELITTKERIPRHWEKKIKWQSNKQSIRKSSYSGSVCAAFIPTNYWDLISPHYKSCPLQLALVDKLSLKQSLNWRKAVCDSYVSISKEAEELIWKCYKTLTGFFPPHRWFPQKAARSRREGTLLFHWLHACRGIAALYKAGAPVDQQRALLVSDFSGRHAVIEDHN